MIIPLKEHYTKFPNKFSQCDIRQKYGVSRKFYITYILIDKYRTIENYSWITIKKILEFYGYKTTIHKPKAFREIIEVLEYMVSNNMIEIRQDLDSISYDTGIEVKILTDEFDCSNRWSKVTSSTINQIIHSESPLNKENLLLSFLYVNSFIGCRPKDELENEQLENPTERPEAFYRNLHIMSKELAMSRETVTKCMQCLVNEEILKKMIVGSVSKNNKLQNVPHIYVLNKKGYEQEMEWAFLKMKKIYSVESFAKQIQQEGDKKNNARNN